MPLTKVFIKNLPSLLNTSQLIGKKIEVEGVDANGNPLNFSLPFGLLLQTINENLAGPNNRHDLHKAVRFYSKSEESPSGDSSLERLNEQPDFLCLGTVCRVELPKPGEADEYILVWDPAGLLNVWRDATFLGEKVTARWVVRGSKEQYTTSFVEFNALAVRYNQNDTVRYTIGGVRRIFEAKQNLIKANYTPAVIPAPTGQASDTNWNEINPIAPSVRPEDMEALKTLLLGKIADATSVLVDWQTNTTYPLSKTVVYNGRLYRNTTASLQSTLPPPQDASHWEAIGGSGDGAQVVVGTVLDDNVLIDLHGITEVIGGLNQSSFVGTQDELWRKILIKYQVPAFTSFTLNGASSRTIEAGELITSPVTLGWSISNSQNIQPNKISIRDVNNNFTLISNSANDGSESVGISSYTLDVNQSKQYQISTLNSQNETLSATLTLSTALRRYWGTLSAAPAAVKAALGTQTADTLGFTGTDLSSAIALNNDYNATGGKYIYYLYPAALGNPTIVRNGAADDFSAYSVEDIAIRDRFNNQRLYFNNQRLYKLFYTLYQTGANVNINIIG